MQWSAEPQAGFSTAEKTIHPVIAEGIYDYRQINVEAQQRDPNSLLNWTARMIRLRKESPEIGWGEWTILSTGTSKVLAMCYTWRGNALIVIHNFDHHPHEVRLKPRIEGGDRLVNLLVEDESTADARGIHHIALDAYHYRWYRVGGLNHVLRRGRV